MAEDELPRLRVKGFGDLVSSSDDVTQATVVASFCESSGPGGFTIEAVVDKEAGAHPPTW